MVPLPNTVPLPIWSHSQYGPAPNMVPFPNGPPPIWSHFQYGPTPNMVPLPIWSHSQYGPTPNMVPLPIWSHSQHIPVFYTVPYQYSTISNTFRSPIRSCCHYGSFRNTVPFPLRYCSQLCYGCYTPFRTTSGRKAEGLVRRFQKFFCLSSTERVSTLCRRVITRATAPKIIPLPFLNNEKGISFVLIKTFIPVPYNSTSHSKIEYQGPPERIFRERHNSSNLATRPNVCTSSVCPELHPAPKKTPFPTVWCN